MRGGHVGAPLASQVGPRGGVEAEGITEAIARMREENHIAAQGLCERAEASQGGAVTARHGGAERPEDRVLLRGVALEGSAVEASDGRALRVENCREAVQRVARIHGLALVQHLSSDGSGIDGETPVGDLGPQPLDLGCIERLS